MLQVMKLAALCYNSNRNWCSLWVYIKEDTHTQTKENWRSCCSCDGLQDLVMPKPEHCPSLSLSLLLPLIMGKKILPCLSVPASKMMPGAYNMIDRDEVTWFSLAAREAGKTGTQLLQWNLNMNQNSPRVQNESTLQGLETLLSCPEVFCCSVNSSGPFFPICLTKS